MVTPYEWILEIQKKSVLELDVSEIEDMREGVRSELETHGTFRPSRMLIVGYDQDPRELYQIPEVRKWCAAAVDRVPFLPLVLTGDSIPWFVSCVLDVVVIDRTRVISTTSSRAVAALLMKCAASFRAFCNACRVGGAEGLVAQRVGELQRVLMFR